MIQREMFVESVRFVHMVNRKVVKLLSLSMATSPKDI